MYAVLLDNVIKQVSKVIGRDWKPLARKLGCEEAEIKEIEEKEQIYQFLANTGV